MTSLAISGRSIVAQMCRFAVIRAVSRNIKLNGTQSCSVLQLNISDILPQWGYTAVALIHHVNDYTFSKITWASNFQLPDGWPWQSRLSEWIWGHRIHPFGQKSQSYLSHEFSTTAKSFRNRWHLRKIHAPKKMESNWDQCRRMTSRSAQHHQSVGGLSCFVKAAAGGGHYVNYQTLC